MGESASVLINILEQGALSDEIGRQPASDLLTKAITQPSAWEAFYDFMGLKAAGRAALDEAESCEGPGERQSKVAALVGVVVGLAAWKPVEMLGRIARLLGLAAGVVKLSRMFEKK